MAAAGVGLLLACLLGGVVSAGTAQAALLDAASAEAFVRRLYRSYGNDNHRGSPSSDRRTLLAIATPRLAALVQRDNDIAAAAHDGTYLDSDPICGCQDDGGIKIASITAQVEATGRATAVAVLQFSMQRVTRRFVLRGADGRSCIDDITDGDGQDSVREFLTRSLPPSTQRPARR